MIAPVTFWVFFHSAEDQYQKWAIANFLRIVRLFAYFTTILAPALYIGLVNYHQSMIPIDLLLSIASSREIVPFPAAVEVILMEAAFELIREASARTPSTLGATLNTVGGLIIGQAAIQASIISPISIIVISVAALSSYAIPENGSYYMVRITRFAFLLATLIFGYLGLAAILVVSLGYLESVKSFGVPFFSPFSPYNLLSQDTIFRPVIWKQVLRPFNISPEKYGNNSKRGTNNG